MEHRPSPSALPSSVPTDAVREADDASGHPSRRDFAKTLAVAVAAGPLLAGAGACAPPSAVTAAGATPSAAPPPAPSTQEPADPVAVALAEVIRLRYGSRLTVQQLEQVRKGIEGNLQAVRTLRAFDLPISTEPPTAFRAFRGGAG